jgi:hypothetical protein
VLHEVLAVAADDEVDVARLGPGEVLPAGEQAVRLGVRGAFIWVKVPLTV